MQRHAIVLNAPSLLGAWKDTVVCVLTEGTGFAGSQRKCPALWEVRGLHRAESVTHQKGMPLREALRLG